MLIELNLRFLEMNHSAATNIYFHWKSPKINLKNRRLLKSFLLKQLFKHHRKVKSLSFIFCSDPFLLKINQAFLKHNYYTDIITFDLSETKNLEAEVYISIDRVRDNAKTFGVSFQEELHRVIFHGILHLCGFKDKTQKDQEKMRIQERKLIDNYFIRAVPRGTS